MAAHVLQGYGELASNVLENDIPTLHHLNSYGEKRELIRKWRSKKSRRKEGGRVRVCVRARARARVCVCVCADEGNELSALGTLLTGEVVFSPCHTPTRTVPPGACTARGRPASTASSSDACRRRKRRGRTSCWRPAPTPAHRLEVACSRAMCSAAMNVQSEL